MKFSRRAILRASAVAGGAAFLAPLAQRFASADGATPCRFVFFVEGNGYEPKTILSPTARAAIDSLRDSPIDGRRWNFGAANDSPLDLETPDLGQAECLAPLETAGLVDQTTAILGLSSKIVGGGHSGFHGALSSTRTVGGSPGGPTIDAYLAARITEDPLTLAASLYGWSKASLERIRAR